MEEDAFTLPSWASAPGPAGAASPSGATAGFAESRSTHARAWQPRRQLPSGSHATRCCREYVRPGKDECEERSDEKRGRARFVRPERPGCGAGLSRAGASRPTRGSGLLTRWGLDTLRSRPRPPCAKQGRVECHPRPRPHTRRCTENDAFSTFSPETSSEHPSLTSAKQA